MITIAHEDPSTIYNIIEWGAMNTISTKSTFKYAEYLQLGLLLKFLGLLLRFLGLLLRFLGLLLF